MRWAGFVPQMFIRSTELSATTKLSLEQETPAFWVGAVMRSFIIIHGFQVNVLHCMIINSLHDFRIVELSR